MRFRDGRGLERGGANRTLRHPGGHALSALLRGVNVGGKNKLPMSALASLFEEVGCRDVETYIQSGNVVFTAPERVAARIPRLLSERISDRLGLTTPVLVRTREELAAVGQGNPHLAVGADPYTLLVMFLADRPGPALVARLDARRSPPDQFEVRGREIYLRCPNGFARTKFTNAYFDARLATTSTGRNWRTVLRLVEMTGGTTATSASQPPWRA